MADGQFTREIQALLVRVNDELQGRIDEAHEALQRGDLQATGQALSGAERIGWLLRQLADEVGFIPNGEDVIHE